MTSSRLRHIGPAAVLALTASGGIALVTAASPAAAVTPHATPVPSSGYSLSIAVAMKSISPGDSDTVSGVLTQGGVAAAGDTVYLRARADGKWFGHRAGHATTGADGSVQFTVKPSDTTHYRLVFRVPATTPTPTPTATPVTSAAAPQSTIAARSAVATVHVVRPSSLSIREKQRHGNGREIISGQLRGGGHALAHRKVTLEEQAVGDTTWTTVATRRTGRHGVVEFLAPKGTTAEEFELVYAGGANYTGCQSGVVTVTVA
jgi:hypothetical protein